MSQVAVPEAAGGGKGLFALFAVRVMNYNDCRDAEYLARYCITKELIR